MTDPDKIRLESLKETLKQTQRYMILGIGRAVILLSVIIQSPELAESGTKVVKLPFIGEVKRMMAGFVLIIAGCAFGAVAVSGVNRIAHVAREIEDESLVKAALTFPSILTIRNVVLRVTSSLLPPVALVCRLPCRTLPF